ncbi:MAG: RDD family protein [Candidatus Heimdallarchaeota archaeon]|nr:RDD family protein [Candidatus Heimdallarchaeota archaeon]
MARVRAMSKPAPLLDRCIASLIDGFICSPLSVICYPVWKDGIRDGHSFGKGLMGLRVVKYGTRQGASVSNSCLRNCCHFGVGLCLLCFNGDRRHLGDYIAGTMVVKDR